jgi:hypothetical protein
MAFLQLRSRPPDVVAPGPAIFAVADPVGVATFVGVAVMAGVLSVTGAGTATFVAPTPPTAPVFPPPLQRPYVFGPGGGLQYRSRTSPTIATLPLLGVLDAAGTATFTGASLGAAPLSAAGVGTATFVGASGGSLLSATGTGAATFVGASQAASGFAVNDPVGTATFTSAPLMGGACSAAGVGVATFTSTAIGAGHLGAAGHGTAIWVSTAPAQNTGSGQGGVGGGGAITGGGNERLGGMDDFS